MTIITIHITTRHKRETEKEKFRISLYIMYEDIKECVNFHNDFVIKNKINKMSRCYSFNFKDILGQFNYFTNNRLSLEEVKVILELEDCIKLIYDNIYNDNSHNKEEKNRKINNLVYDNICKIDKHTIVLKSGLYEMYKFIDDDLIQIIKLYTRDELFSMRRDYSKKKLKHLEKDIIEIENHLGNNLDRAEYSRLESNCYGLFSIQESQVLFEEAYWYSQENLNKLYKEYFFHKEIIDM